MKHVPRALPALAFCMVLTFVLAACGGGGDTPATKTGGASTLTAQSAADIINCPTGGVALDYGIDDNKNGVLDSGEVDGTAYICNGVDTNATQPVASAGPDQSTSIGATVMLDGNMSFDPGGDALTYSWSFAPVAAGSSLTSADILGANTANAAFMPDVEGTYVVQLVVNDGTTDSAADTATITVAPSGMAAIPTGCFYMGDAFGEGVDAEIPVHGVCITGFYMDRHEVTNEEYAACVTAGSCTEPYSPASISRASYYGEPTYDNFPVINVNWTQATDYCEWAGKRLPTEAEWEYAARGGLSDKRYPWGDTITGTDANYQNSGDAWDNDTSPVENYAANGYGLYDMTGNVSEWVKDCYDTGYYSVSPTNDPQGPLTGAYRVFRGGYWGNVTQGLRVSYRGYNGPTFGNAAIGLRCARNP